MKDVDLDVKVTYRVGLGVSEVPDLVVEQLNKIHSVGFELDGMGVDYPEANEWLKDNVKEHDCCDLEYEIIDLNIVTIPELNAKHKLRKLFKKEKELKFRGAELLFEMSNENYIIWLEKLVNK